ncbi:MAG: peptidylprolyl isomerase [Candidatus Poseidoniaceae archaeon]|jgi:FKBP-type peptidyl-prolyl cis-trans isomerase SlyD|nr:peptidylprolyl isomerase [Candidatus Poseidoniaceae archaeon]MDP7203090.1 peptidylprolyl isomerase [Candidatus Poseidoniaceae archaeon]
MSEDITMSENVVASVHYTGTLADDEVFDSSEGKDPLTFLVGHQQMIPGFEQEMLGAAVGEQRTFTLEPDRAYGQRDEEGVIQIPREQFPEEMELEEGMMLVAEMGGNPAPFNIIAVSDETVTADFNHKLAGQTLTFSVEVVELRMATDEELSHGHVHGPGGHHH